MAFFKRKKDKDERSTMSEDELNQNVRLSKEDEKAKKQRERHAMLYRMKLGSHFKMETFIRSVGLLFILLCLMLGTAYYKSHVNRKNELSTLAITADKFAFSQGENQTGKVVSVARKEDNKTAFILLKFERNANMTTDAKQYQLFVTGMDNTDMTYKPAGSIFFFGATGYMGIELHDERGIQNQPLQITIRNNSELGQLNGNQRKKTGDVDRSFDKYNQAKVLVNPGAADAISLESDLNTSHPDVLYKQLIGLAEDAKLRQKYNASVKELHDNLLKFNELNQRLDSSGFNKVDLPDVFKGDTFDKDGYYHFEKTVPGGIPLDINKTNLMDGYIHAVTNIDQLSSYLKKLDSEKRGKEKMVEPFNQLTRHDGSKLNMSESKDYLSPNEKQAIDLMSQINATLEGMLSAKQRMQMEESRAFLKLDAECLSQNHTFTVRTDPDTVKVY